MCINLSWMEEIGSKVNIRKGFVTDAVLYIPDQCLYQLNITEAPKTVTFWS